MYKKILVPLDGSDLAEQVLPHVIELARSCGAEIILLRVATVPVYDYLVTEPQWGIELRREAERETVEYLERMKRDVAARGLKVRTRAGLDGNVDETILNTAQELNVDLIAMSTHGRTGLARLVMGSVADQIVRHAEVPVLLVRPHPVRVPVQSSVRASFTPLPAL
ncbi:MAG TPA: universal stress protein [Anaerolineae bacterium]|nr:universal stress protein [Anaerolineae bacterium]